MLANERERERLDEREGSDQYIRVVNLLAFLVTADENHHHSSEEEEGGRVLMSLRVVMDKV